MTKTREISDILTGVAFTGDVSLGDNNKAIFGAGSDLQIYHDGSNSYVKDAGTGDLYIQGTQLRLQSATGESFFVGVADGSAYVYHNGSAKLETTSEGIDVTGTVTADGGLIIDNSNPNLLFKESDTSDLNTRLNSNFGSFRIASTNNAGSTYTQRFNVDHATGDISFYEDTGTTAKLTWDASAESLKFADSGKAIFGAGSDLQIYHDGSNSYISNSTGNLIIQDTDGGTVYIRGKAGENSIIANDDGSVQLYFDNAEKLNTTSTGIEVTGNVVSEVAINTQTGTTYTTVLADQSKLVTLNNGSAITLTIPANSSVAYPVGTKIDITQLGAGQVTVAGAGGVTVNATPTLKLRARYSAATCIKIATDTWLLVGDLAES